MHSILAPDPAVLARKFVFYDSFRDIRPAGTLNGTPCLPPSDVLIPGTPATRTVVDTENKLSLAGGQLVCAGGKAAPAWGDPGFIASCSIARQVGLTLDFAWTATAGYWCHAGLSGTAVIPSAQSNFNNGAGVIFNAANNHYGCIVSGNERKTGIPYAAGDRIRIQADDDKGDCRFYFRKGGVWVPAWLEHFTTAALWPTLSNYNAAAKFDYFKVSLLRPQPWTVEDTFGRVNADTLGPTAYESGQAWNLGNAGDLATLPTWGIRTDKAALIAAGTQEDPQAWVESGVANGLIWCEIIPDPAADGHWFGFVVRRRDATHYLLIKADNANHTISIWKNAGSGASQVASAANTFVDGQETDLVIQMYGTDLRVWVDGNHRIAYTDNDYSTETKHGLAGTGTGARYNNFRILGPWDAA